MNFTVTDAFVTIKDFKPMLEDHDKQRVKTVRLNCEMNRSAYFQQTLFPESTGFEDALWDSDEGKRPGVQQIVYDTEFHDVVMSFKDNGQKTATLGGLVRKLKLNPMSGKALKITFQADCVCTDGVLDQLHDMLKSNTVTLTTSLVSEPLKEAEPLPEAEVA